MKEVRLHGRGGQGLIKAAHIIVKAAVNTGQYGSFIPYFGVERKGSPVYGFLRLHDKPIMPKTQVYKPNCLIILDDTLIGQVDVYDGISEDSILIINTKSSITDFNIPTQVKKVGLVDATDIALKHLGRNIPNTIMLGAFCKTTGWLSIDAIGEVVEEDFDEKNLVASKEGFELTNVFTEGWKVYENNMKDVNVESKKSNNKMDKKWISPLGDEGLNAIDTGKWRVFRPEIDHSKCVVCGICAQYCPVGAIRKEKPTDNKIFIDLNYCKGCGICKVECPREAISMSKEEGDL